MLAVWLSKCSTTVGEWRRSHGLFCSLRRRESQPQGKGNPQSSVRHQANTRIRHQPTTVHYFSSHILFPYHKLIPSHTFPSPNWHPSRRADWELPTSLVPLNVPPPPTKRDSISCLPPRLLAFSSLLESSRTSYHTSLATRYLGTSTLPTLPTSGQFTWSTKASSIDRPSCHSPSTFAAMLLCPSTPPA